MTGVKVIGGAIIPELTNFVNWIVKGTIAARDWLKDHKGIVVAALQVTGAIVAGGLAFSLLGGVLGMPSSPEPSGSTAPAKCSWLPAQ